MELKSSLLFSNTLHEHPKNSSYPLLFINSWFSPFYDISNYCDYRSVAQKPIPSAPALLYKSTLQNSDLHNPLKKIITINKIPYLVTT